MEYLYSMKKYLYSLLSVFPTPNIERTSEFYEKVMGFRAVKYLDVKDPYICLYRDNTEIILTKASTDKVYPNRELYGFPLIILIYSNFII